MTKKIKQIEILKCIAILFVVIYHFYPTNKVFILNRGDVFSLFLYYCQSIMSTCIPLFFFSS